MAPAALHNINSLSYLFTFKNCVVVGFKRAWTEFNFRPFVVAVNFSQPGHLIRAEMPDDTQVRYDMSPDGRESVLVCFERPQVRHWFSLLENAAFRLSCRVEVWFFLPNSTANHEFPASWSQNTWFEAAWLIVWVRSCGNTKFEKIFVGFCRMTVSVILALLQFAISSV